MNKSLDVSVDLKKSYLTKCRSQITWHINMISNNIYFQYIYFTHIPSIINKVYKNQS